MPDSQPAPPPTATPPSTAPADAPAGASSPPSPAPEEHSGGNLFERFFRKREKPQAAASEGFSAEPSAEGAQASAASAETAAPQSLQLSPDELERRVQAETDRREAKRQAEQKTADKKRLRKEDPYAYAEQEEAEEVRQDVTAAWDQTFSTFGKQHDQAVLDPVLQALPAPEQQRILKLEGAGVGLPGRALIVGEALKALEKHWRAEGRKDAEASLRKNPAFLKQVLRDRREEAEEPELLAGGNPTRNGRRFEDLILRDYRAQRGT